MKATVNTVVAIVLTTLSLLAVDSAHAASQPYEFHTDARMVHASLGTIPRSYGYMNVLVDEAGEGVINVMFSNGSQLYQVRFNARVKFLNEANVVIGEEYFECWLGTAEVRGEKECKVSESLIYSDFEEVEVDFYLSDILDLAVSTNSD